MAKTVNNGYFSINMCTVIHIDHLTAVKILLARKLENIRYKRPCNSNSKFQLEQLQQSILALQVLMVVYRY